MLHAALLTAGYKRCPSHTLKRHAGQQLRVTVLLWHSTFHADEWHVPSCVSDVSAPAAHMLNCSTQTSGLQSFQQVRQHVGPYFIWPCRYTQELLKMGAAHQTISLHRQPARTTSGVGQTPPCAWMTVTRHNATTPPQRRRVTWEATVRAVLVREVEVPQRQRLVVGVKYGDARRAHNRSGDLVVPSPCPHLFAAQLFLSHRPAALMLPVAKQALSAAVCPPAQLSQHDRNPCEDPPICMQGT